MTKVRPGMVLVAMLGMAAPVAAQQMEWSGNVMPRMETRDIDGGESFLFTGMQTRVALARALNGDARLFFQLQDVRLWGEERSLTDGSAEALDLHQGYLELGHRGESLLWLRAGRQEMEFGQGRLVGAPAWTLTGQAFDGVRSALRTGGAGVVDVFWMQLREAETGTFVSDAVLLGAWGEWELGSGSDRVIQLFALHDRNEAGFMTRRTTLGSEYAAAVGIVSYRAEGAYQTGELNGVDVNAWMLSGGVDAPVLEGKGNVGLAYDLYSGSATPDAGETEAFSDLFGRNHRFFGYADLFSDIPTDTQGRGIQDLVVKLGWNLPRDARLSVDLHRFTVADDEGLSGDILADELDFGVHWPAMAGVDLTTGVSWVGLGDAGETVGLAAGDLVFAYLQLRAGF